MKKANKIAEETHTEFLDNVSSYLDLVAEKEAEAALKIEEQWAKSLNGIFSSIDSAMDMYN
jgi:Xaa-Pro aminopeptidase